MIFRVYVYLPEGSDFRVPVTCKFSKVGDLFFSTAYDDPGQLRPSDSSHSRNVFLRVAATGAATLARGTFKQIMSKRIKKVKSGKLYHRLISICGHVCWLPAGCILIFIGHLPIAGGSPLAPDLQGRQQRAAREEAVGQRAVSAAAGDPENALLGWDHGTVMELSPMLSFWSCKMRKPKSFGTKPSSDLFLRF